MSEIFTKQLKKMLSHMRFLRFSCLTAKNVLSSVAATGLKRLLEKFLYRSIEFFRHFFIRQVPDPF